MVSKLARKQARPCLYYILLKVGLGYFRLYDFYQILGQPILMNSSPQKTLRVVGKNFIYQALYLGEAKVGEAKVGYSCLSTILQIPTLWDRCGVGLPKSLDYQKRLFRNVWDQDLTYDYTCFYSRPTGKILRVQKSGTQLQCRPSLNCTHIRPADYFKKSLKKSCNLSSHGYCYTWKKWQR